MPTRRDLLSTYRDVSFIAAIYLYFIGWTYQFYFYSQFGVSLNMIDVPIYYFFIYSFSVLAHYFSFLIVSSVLVVVYVFVLIALSLTPPVRTFLCPSRKYLILSAAVLLFPIGFYGARESGELTAKEIRSGHFESKTVRMVLKKDKAELYPQDFVRANKAGQLKILTETKDTYIVVLQPYDNGSQRETIPYGYTYFLPKTDVDLLTVEMRDFSREEISQ